MKKIGYLLVLATVLFSASVSSAEEMQGMENKGSMKKGMMGGKMMGSMMMKMMSEKSVVATSDGGIVVLAGNKLTKYDSNLNVIKEADVKVDMNAMQKDMTAMMKMCPMMGDMKEGEAEVESSDDHSAHH